MKEKVKEVFNQLSQVYATTVDSQSLFNKEYERPAMLRELPIDLQNKKVLDAGCAAGWYSYSLLEKGANVTAADVSEEMVTAAKERLKDRVEVFCIDLEAELPFKDNSFDIILCSLTLHYIKDWNTTFHEFKRVLKPDGCLLYSVHHPFSDTTLLSEEANYYSTEFIIKKWNKEGKTYEVPCYHRPLQSIINDTSKYFTIEKLLEPIPTQEFKVQQSEKYEQVLHKPQFILVKCINRKL